MSVSVTSNNLEVFQQDASSKSREKSVEVNTLSPQCPRVTLGDLRSKQNSFNSETSALSAVSSISSVESLLEARRENPEEILIALGFGGDSTQDLLSRIPQRFLTHQSQARGVNLESFLQQQEEVLQRQEYGCLGYLGLSARTPTHNRLPSGITSKILDKIGDNDKKQRSPSYPNTVSIRDVVSAVKAASAFRSGKMRHSSDSILDPANREFLEKQGQEDPLEKPKKLIIGTHSYSFDHEGTLIQSPENVKKEDENSKLAPKNLKWKEMFQKLESHATAVLEVDEETLKSLPDVSTSDKNDEVFQESGLENAEINESVNDTAQNKERYFTRSKKNTLGRHSIVRQSKIDDTEDEELVCFLNTNPQERLKNNLENTPSQQFFENTLQIIHDESLPNRSILSSNDVPSKDDENSVNLLSERTPSLGCEIFKDTEAHLSSFTKEKLAVACHAPEIKTLPFSPERETIQTSVHRLSDRIYKEEKMKDSFELDELSPAECTDGETLPTGTLPSLGIISRTCSPHSESSGFADEDCPVETNACVIKCKAPPVKENCVQNDPIQEVFPVCCAQHSLNSAVDPEKCVSEENSSHDSEINSACPIESHAIDDIQDSFCKESDQSFVLNQNLALHCELPSSSNEEPIKQHSTPLHSQYMYFSEPNILPLSRLHYNEIIDSKVNYSSVPVNNERLPDQRLCESTCPLSAIHQKSLASKLQSCHLSGSFEGLNLNSQSANIVRSRCSHKLNRTKSEMCLKHSEICGCSLTHSQSVLELPPVSHKEIYGSCDSVRVKGLSVSETRCLKNSKNLFIMQHTVGCQVDFPDSSCELSSDKAAMYCTVERKEIIRKKSNYSQLNSNELCGSEEMSTETDSRACACPFETHGELMERVQSQQALVELHSLFLALEHFKLWDRHLEASLTGRCGYMYQHLPLEQRNSIESLQQLRIDIASEVAHMEHLLLEHMQEICSARQRSVHRNHKSQHFLDAIKRMTQLLKEQSAMCHQLERLVFQSELCETQDTKVSEECKNKTHSPYYDVSNQLELWKDEPKTDRELMYAQLQSTISQIRNDIVHHLNIDDHLSRRTGAGHLSEDQKHVVKNEES